MFKNEFIRFFSCKITRLMIVLFIMLFASYSVVIAQEVEWQWAESTGGAGTDEAHVIAVDDDGNCYVAGEYNGSVDFGSTTLNGYGDQDIFIAKLDSDGNWLWAVRAGGSGSDKPRGITIDDGYVYVTGSFENTATFGSTSLVGTSSLIGSSETIFVSKLDIDGNWQWSKKAGAWAYDWADDIVVDTSGNIYITGCFLWYCVFGSDSLFTDDFEMNASGFPVNGYHWDAFVAKLDSDGNWLWETNAGGSSANADEGYGIEINSSGNLIITGDYNETAHFDGFSLTGEGSGDIFIGEMDTNGSWLWVESAGGPCTEYVYELGLDDAGNAYITGQYKDSVSFGSTTLYHHNADTDWGDIFVAKLGSDHTWKWAKDIGGIYIDYGLGLKTDAHGNTYVVGWFQETAHFGSITLNSPTLGLGDSEFFVAKIDTDGNWLWAKNAGGIDADFGRAVDVDSDGMAYAVGSIETTATFGSDELTSEGDKDIVVTKLGSMTGLESFTENFDEVTPPALPTDWLSCIDVLLSNTVADLYTTVHGTAPSSPNAAFIMNGINGSNGQLDATAFVSLITPLVEVGDYGSTLTFWATGGNPVIVGTMSDPTDTTTFTPIEEITLDYTFTEYNVTISTRGSTYLAFKNGNILACNPVFIDDVSYEQNEQALTSFTENFDEITPPALPADWSSCIDVLLTNTAADLYTTAHGTAPSSPNAVFIMNGLNGSTGQIDTTAFVSLVSPMVEVGENGATVTFWALSGNPIVVGTMSDPTDTTTFTPIEEFALSYTFTEYSVSITNSGTTYLAFMNGNTMACNPVFVDNISFEQNSTLIGDFDGDGYVGATDLQMFGDHWHFVDTDPGWDVVYDLDPDGIIDAADLQIFGDHWHEGVPPTLVKGETKGPNADAGIVFDLDSGTTGNQNLTHIESQPAGTHIRVDVYATGVHNLDTYEFEVIYNPDELDYISCSATNPLTYEGNILESEGGTAVGWMVDNSTPGILSIAYTLTGTDTLEAPEGEGLVADIVFQAKVTTHGTLSFGDVYYYDTFGVSDLITDTGTATLPVELSAFTAVYDADYTTLSWTTASETDILGFNIYRSVENEFDTSKKLNADMVAGHGTTTEMNTYEFMDIDQLNINTTYYYWLESVEFGGINTVYTSINITPEEGTGGFENDFDSNSLSNFPNPIKGSTTILYSVKGMLVSKPVEINIYNMLGQLVDTVEGRDGEATWNTGDHATGIYFYKLNTETYSEIKKMMVTK